VYVDFLQNTRGKTLATAYSVRGTPDAGVSTPVTWEEIDAGFDRGDFTLRTIDARLRGVGDLWAALRRARGADLSALVSGTRARAAAPAIPRRRPRALRAAR
jgi:DNA primase